MWVWSKNAPRSGEDIDKATGDSVASMGDNLNAAPFLRFTDAPVADSRNAAVFSAAADPTKVPSPTFSAGLSSVVIAAEAKAKAKAEQDALFGLSRKKRPVFSFAAAQVGAAREGWGDSDEEIDENAAAWASDIAKAAASSRDGASYRAVLVLSGHEQPVSSLALYQRSEVIRDGLTSSSGVIIKTTISIFSGKK